MAEVVSFPRRDEHTLIWVCNCGCTTHYHRATGDVECGSCGNIASISGDGEWRRRLPEAAAAPADLDSDAFKTIDLTGADAFLRRQQKTPADSIAAVIVVGLDGGLSTWGAGSIDTAERGGWLQGKLAEAGERLCRALTP